MLRDILVKLYWKIKEEITMDGQRNVCPKILHFQDAIPLLVTQLNEVMDLILGHGWLLRHKDR